jgi:hypothetical protein
MLRPAPSRPTARRVYPSSGLVSVIVCHCGPSHHYPWNVGEQSIAEQVRRESAALAARLLAAVEPGQLTAPNRLIRLLASIRDAGPASVRRRSRR